jgi:hypothetical protein
MQHLAALVRDEYCCTALQKAGSRNPIPAASMYMRRGVAKAIMTALSPSNAATENARAGPAQR